VKHVLIETNFLMEVARPCPQAAAERLLQRNGHDVTLYVPWCSVTEARRTLHRVIDDDLGFEQAMLKFAVRELLPAGDRAALATLNAFAVRAREARRVAKAGADGTINALVDGMQIIPPSPDVIAETLRIWTVKTLPPFDEMVLGAVIAKAAELHRNGEREIFFCNLNKSDFSPLDRGGVAVARPSLDTEYARCGLRYLPSFDVPA
jgi:hypothetical protein